MTWVDDVAVAVDPVTRARAMAAALPGAGIAEAVIDVPYEVAWSRIADLEHSVAQADRLVSRIRITARDGERLQALSWSPAGLRMRFDVLLEDGYCLMQSRHRAFVVVMAARPEGDGTRYCHVEAVPRRLGRLLRPLLQLEVAHDVAGFSRVAAAG